jgi:hypothetical protein
LPQENCYPITMTSAHARLVLFPILLISCALPFPTVGQRAFVTTIDGENRSYLLAQSGVTVPNQPLIIILHDNGGSAFLAFRSESLWKKLSSPAILAFPSAKNSHWQCNGDPGTDVNLLQKIIDDVYQNYRVDRNRVYIIGEGESYCLATLFNTTYPAQVTAIAQHIRPTVSSSDNEIVEQGNTLLRSGPENEVNYELWKKAALSYEEQKEKQDSVKRTRWHKRVTVDFRTGGMVMLPSVKTNSDDKTYMDISDANQWLSFSITKWMDDSMAWFVDINWLKIPRKQEIKFSYQGTNVLIKGEGGGGAVVPITVGFKYALHQYAFRPYFKFGTGPMAVVVLGGRFKTTSTTNMDPSAMRDNIEMEIRTVFHVALGSGFDWRLNKRLFLSGHLQYLHSAQFNSAGQVNAIRGFTANAGGGFIFGINKG